MLYWAAHGGHIKLVRALLVRGGGVTGMGLDSGSAGADGHSAYLSCPPHIRHILPPPPRPTQRGQDGSGGGGDDSSDTKHHFQHLKAQHERALCEREVILSPSIMPLVLQWK